MGKQLEDIVAASVCKFNVEIDIEGKLAPNVSTERCEELCEYCRMAAQYICAQIEENENVIE